MANRPRPMANPPRRLIRSPAVRNILTEDRPIAQIQIDRDQAIQDRILQEQIEETNRQGSEDKKAEEKKGKGKKMKGGNIKLAVIAQEVYDEPSKRTGRDGWKYESGDKRHGIWSKDGKAVVGIRGTDFKDVKDVADDVAIGIGALKLTPRYKRAKKWVKKAIKKYGKKNVEVAGHSLGGKIAKELAKDFGIRGSTFNAGASVSDAASSILDRTACKVNKKGKRCKRAKKVENYRTAIDPVSAAAVADINTTTVKRKKGKDPHAIANFVPEGSEQEGEGEETDEETTEDDIQEEDDEEMEDRLLRQEGVKARQFFMKIDREGEKYFEFWEAKIAPTTLSKEEKEQAKDIILNSYTNAYLKYVGDEEKEENILKEGRENADKLLVSEGLMKSQEGGYYGMRGRGMCGTGSKRYDFTQSGTGRKRMMKSKNMVEVAPKPQPKKKVLSQKEYCSLYRC